MVVKDTVRTGCLLYNLLMLIPLLLIAAIVLLAGSLTGMLPKQVNDPVISVEQFAARTWLNLDLGGSSLSVRDVSLTPTAAGHANLRVDVNAGTLPPAGTRLTVAVAAFKVVGSHLGMPLGLAADRLDRVTVAFWGPAATSPAFTASVDAASLKAWHDGSITDAAFTAKVVVK